MIFPSAQQFVNNAGVGYAITSEQQFMIYMNATHKQLQMIQQEFCELPSILLQLDAVNRQLQVLDPHVRAVNSPWGANIQRQLVNWHMNALVFQVEDLRLQIFGPQKAGTEKAAEETTLETSMVGGAAEVSQK